MLGASFGHMLKQILILNSDSTLLAISGFLNLCAKTASRAVHPAAATTAVAAVVAAMCAGSREVR